MVGGVQHSTALYSTPHTPHPLLATTTIWMQRTITDWFINDDVAITDFNVVQAWWIRTNPGLILNGCSLATEIRKRNQITFTTFATPRKCVFHEIASFLLSGGNIRLPCTVNQARLNKNVSRGGASAAASASPQQVLTIPFLMIPQLSFSVSSSVKIFSFFKPVWSLLAS